MIKFVLMLIFLALIGNGLVLISILEQVKIKSKINNEENKNINKYERVEEYCKEDVTNKKTIENKNYIVSKKPVVVTIKDSEVKYQDNNEWRYFVWVQIGESEEVVKIESEAIYNGIGDYDKVTIFEVTVKELETEKEIRKTYEAIE